MLKRGLALLGNRKPRNPETPYSLLPSFPVSDEYVTDVTSHLNGQSREAIEEEFPNARNYRAFLGLPSRDSAYTHRKVPTIVATGYRIHYKKSTSSIRTTLGRTAKIWFSSLFRKI